MIEEASFLAAARCDPVPSAGSDTISIETRVRHSPDLTHRLDRNRITSSGAEVMTGYSNRCRSKHQVRPTGAAPTPFVSLVVAKFSDTAVSTNNRSTSASFPAGDIPIIGHFFATQHQREEKLLLMTAAPGTNVAANSQLPRCRVKNAQLRPNCYGVFWKR